MSGCRIGCCRCKEQYQILPVYAKEPCSGIIWIRIYPVESGVQFIYEASHAPLIFGMALAMLCGGG